MRCCSHHVDKAMSSHSHVMVCFGGGIGRLRNTHARTLKLRTCALIHTCFSVIIHSRCTHPHTHTAGAG